MNKKYDVIAPMLLILTGPTAVGKTDWAIALAERYPLALISLDSVMIYRGMDIGSGKPSSDLLKKHPHALVDICDPDETFSAARCLEGVGEAVLKARQAGQIPCLVGGTMLYLQICLEGLHVLPDRNPECRSYLEARLRSEGHEALYRELKKNAPEAAARIHPHDTQRLIRYWEMWLLQGHVFPEQPKEPPKWMQESTRYVIQMQCSERGYLHQRIAQRWFAMMNQGLIEEVKQLKEAYPYLDQQYPSMRSVGYQQVVAYLAGDYNQQILDEQAIIATRQLAKRQCTWMRRLPCDQIFDIVIPEARQRCELWIEQHMQQAGFAL